MLELNRFKRKVQEVVSELLLQTHRLKDSTLAPMASKVVPDSLEVKRTISLEVTTSIWPMAALMQTTTAPQLEATLIPSHTLKPLAVSLSFVDFPMNFGEINQSRSD